MARKHQHEIVNDPIVAAVVVVVGSFPVVHASRRSRGFVVLADAPTPLIFFFLSRNATIYTSREVCVCIFVVRACDDVGQREAVTATTGPRETLRETRTNAVITKFQFLFLLPASARSHAHRSDLLQSVKELFFCCSARVAQCSSSPPLSPESLGIDLPRLGALYSGIRPWGVGLLPIIEGNDMLWTFATSSRESLTIVGHTDHSSPSRLLSPYLIFLLLLLFDFFFPLQYRIHAN